MSDHEARMPAYGEAPVPPPHPVETQDHHVRAVLAIRPFRQLWLSLGLASFGDWLGLLAITALASNLGGQSSYAAANLAVAGVLTLRLAPAVLFGPLAGAFADRLDRKRTMVVGNLLRFPLLASIPIVGTLWWLFVATVLLEIISLFWLPAKDATVPNLVPRRRLEAANQIGLATTYGTAPIAALLFSGLTLVSGALANVVEFIGGAVDLALYVNALTFLVAALVIWRLDIPAKLHGSATENRPSVWHTITDGWKFLGTTPLIRGLVLGMLGAFGAGGFVIGVAPTYVSDLGAGEPGYGVLFASVFAGLAAGMWVGPRLLADLPRWRMFALSIVAAGVFLALVALIQNIVLVAIFAAALGSAAGVAWVTGYTMLGLEVADELRGRTFAFVQSAARIVLIAVMAFAPALAAVLGRHELRLSDDISLAYNGAALTLLVASVIAVVIGVLSYRQMDDGGGVPLHQDVIRAWQRRHVASPPPRPRAGTGYFVVLEGGDGAGKSTQARLLEQWLVQDLGHDVVLTREPGGTPVGQRLRDLLLHGDSLDVRAEALLFAADRAQHVATVVRPALERGAIVVSDRYTDSSVAYQGAGRAMDGDEVGRLSQWATRGLVPDLTVLLDVPPDVGRRRVGEQTDRLESEPESFHASVRQRFLDLARRHPHRYLVVDAAADPQAVHEQVRERLAPRLPLSARERADLEAREARERAEATERERVAAEEARRRQEAERARREEAERQRRADEQRARVVAEQERRRAEELRRVQQQEARRRRDADAQAHADALRRWRSGEDETATQAMPVPDQTRTTDLREELFGGGDGEEGRGR